MPVMDGYAATAEIRRNPAWKDLPVIAMTASALASDRDHALSSGMNDHVAKPLDVERMFETLARWIHPAHPAPSSPNPDQPSGNARLPQRMRNIDVIDGLARCMNNGVLFERLLRGFLANQARFAERFEQAQLSNQLDDALHLAHDLKGLAGNISAHQLQECADALQHACESRNAARIEVAFAATRDALQALLDELNAIPALRQT